MNAVSVGFLPLEYEWSDDDGREWDLDFKRQELLEISVVPVPANGNALADARSKGIDTRPLVEWAEKTLDQGGAIIIPRAELERLRKAAKEPPLTRPRFGGVGRAALLDDVRARQARLNAPAKRGTADSARRIAELRAIAAAAKQRDPQLIAAESRWRIAGLGR